MKHQPLQVAVNLLVRKFHERSNLIAPGVDNTFRNYLDSIRVASIKADGRDIAAVPDFANAVVQQCRRQKLGSRLQRKRIVFALWILSELSQSIDKGLDRLGSKTILAKSIFKGAGRSREVDAGPGTGSFTLHSRGRKQNGRRKERLDDPAMLVRFQPGGQCF